MKKNYIARLKQYDAKTSLKDKQSLYTKKFIKSCYNPVNKQNQDPNVNTNININTSNKKNHHHSHAKQQNKIVGNEHMLKARTSQRKDEKYENNDRVQQHRSVSQFKEIQINPYECQLNSDHSSDRLFIVQEHNRKIICCQQCAMNYLNKTILFDRQSNQTSILYDKNWSSLVNIKLEFVKLQRFLKQKQIQQTDKCNEYYGVLFSSLKNQYQIAVEYIKQTYKLANQTANQKMLEIQSLLKKHNEEEQTFQSSHSVKFCHFLCPQDSQIELDLASIKLNPHIIQIAKKEMQKFDIRNLGFLNTQQEQPTKPSFSSSIFTNQTKYQSDKKNEQSLTCSQEFIEPKITQTISNQLDISFENNQDFIGGGDYPIIEDVEPEPTSISPSFKYF